MWAFSELLVEPMKGEGMFELARQQAEAAEQRRKPQPTQTVYAPGSMEWFAAKNKTAEPLRRSATAIHRRQPRRAIKELHRWRPDGAIAARERALRLPDHTPLASRPVAIVSPIRVRRMDDNLNDPVTIEAIRTIELNAIGV